VRVLVESGTQRRHNKLWLLLNLEAWYRRWIPRARLELRPRRSIREEVPDRGDDRLDVLVGQAPGTSGGRRSSARSPPPREERRGAAGRHGGLEVVGDGIVDAGLDPRLLRCSRRASRTESSRQRMG
jgi:hypothetical protein